MAIYRTIQITNIVVQLLFMINMSLLSGNWLFLQFGDQVTNNDLNILMAVGTIPLAIVALITFICVSSCKLNTRFIMEIIQLIIMLFNCFVFGLTFFITNQIKWTSNDGRNDFQFYGFISAFFLYGILLILIALVFRHAPHDDFTLCKNCTCTCKRFKKKTKKRQICPINITVDNIIVRKDP